MRGDLLLAVGVLTTLSLANLGEQSAQLRWGVFLAPFDPARWSVLDVGVTFALVSLFASLTLLDRRAKLGAD